MDPKVPACDNHLRIEETEILGMARAAGNNHLRVEKTNPGNDSLASVWAKLYRGIEKETMGVPVLPPCAR